MTQLALELSQLAVEFIEPLETGANTLLPEQSTNLESLTATEDKNDLLAILTLEGSLPVNSSCYCDFCCSGC